MIPKITVAPTAIKKKGIKTSTRAITLPKASPASFASSIMILKEVAKKKVVITTPIKNKTLKIIDAILVLLLFIIRTSTVVITSTDSDLYILLLFIIRTSTILYHIVTSFGILMKNCFKKDIDYDKILIVGIIMEFKRNEKYVEQRARMTVLKDEYALKYQAVSEVYWPRYDRYKKAMKDRVYLIVCASILVVLVTVWVILGGIRNEYLIGASYLVSGGLLAWAIIACTKKNKERLFFMKEWEKENAEVKAISDEIKELGDSMVEEMLMIICYNDYHYDGNMKNWEDDYQKVHDEVLRATGESLAYSDVLEYFNNWVESRS